MKKIRIGIPRAFLYYRYGVLWKNYFESLGCKVIISPETNKEIIELGIRNSSEKYCIPYRIYLGHVLYLSSTCDYIIIANVYNYGKKNQVCPIFNNIFKEIRRTTHKSLILSYDIEHTKFKYESLGLLKIGFKITKNPIIILYSYLYAKEKQNQYDYNRHHENQNKLLQGTKKVLIVSQFYNVQDKFISGCIKEYLTLNNITYVLSSHLDKKIATTFSEYFPCNLEYKYDKEMMGALYYYRYQVDGIIIITTRKCNINIDDIKKYKDIPVLRLAISETNSDNNIKKELERFVNTVKEL